MKIAYIYDAVYLAKGGTGKSYGSKILSEENLNAESDKESCTCER